MYRVGIIEIIEGIDLMNSHARALKSDELRRNRKVGGDTGVLSREGMKEVYSFSGSRDTGGKFSLVIGHLRLAILTKRKYVNFATVISNN